MTVSKESVLAALGAVKLPSGQDIVAADKVRALGIEAGEVRFVLEGGGPEEASVLEGLRARAESVVAALQGVTKVAARTLSAQGPKIGGHAKPQAGPEGVAGVARIIAVGSGKGGVGKSTVSANLAIALAQAGKRVGLLDADIYGPSQARMMGVNRRPASPDGKTILPLQAHGVTVMSMAFMLKEDEAVIWRGPMLMGALQQMLGQVKWDEYGPLDVLVIDLPPGTGDIQLSLCQKTKLDGAIVVSTPQDIAMLDAKKALDMFKRLGTPVLGLVENMSTYICPNCGHEAHLFGHGGVGQAAQEMGLPFLGELPLDLSVRLAGDAGRPIALETGAPAQAYARMAERLIAQGVV